MFNNSSDVLVSVPHKTDEKILATSTNIKPEDLEIHGHISHNDVEKTKDIFSGKHDYFSHDAENIARAC